MSESSGPPEPVPGTRPSGPPTAGGEVSPWANVPWRTIVAAVGIVLATVIAVELVLVAVRIIAWVSIAGFLAIVLAPAVRSVQHRVGGRRTTAVGIVVFLTLGTIIGAITLFLLPVRTQLIQVLTDFPGTLRDAVNGNGTFGKLVSKLHLSNYVRDHEDQLREWANKLSSKSFDIATYAFNTIFAFVTIMVLMFLFLTQAEAMSRTVLGAVPPHRREIVRRTAADAAAAVSGYMSGNLLISLVAGGTSFVCLLALGVPNAFVLSLWVAFADLIPLVGATLGAAVSSLAAFLHSTTAGIVSVIFFIVYQQIENNVLYPAVMARRVKVNTLVVLLSVLLGVELFGVFGAILAVPASGAIQVVAKEIRKERRGEHRADGAGTAEPG